MVVSVLLVPKLQAYADHNMTSPARYNRSWHAAVHVAQDLIPLFTHSDASSIFVWLPSVTLLRRWFTLPLAQRNTIRDREVSELWGHTLSPYVGILNNIT